MIIMAVPSKKTGVCDSRAIYTPPCVVKISDLKQGSGFAAPCTSGSGALGTCDANGLTADGACNLTGNVPALPG